MAQLLTTRTEVEAGPRRVWSVLATPETMSRWMPGVDLVAAPPPVGTGTVLQLHLGPTSRAATITRHQPPDGGAPGHLDLRVVERGVATEYRYEVTDDPDGVGARSVVTTTVDVRPVSVRGWFVTPLARRAIRRVDRDHGERIRTAVLDTPW